mgnify:CR=1 FL=1
MTDIGLTAPMAVIPSLSRTLLVIVVPNRDVTISNALTADICIAKIAATYAAISELFTIIRLNAAFAEIPIRNFIIGYA